jgi:hypothetical protein
MPATERSADFWPAAIMSTCHPNKRDLAAGVAGPGRVQPWVHIAGADSVLQRQYLCAGSEAGRVGDMSYEFLDQQKTSALELSRQWDPEVLHPQYEAVLAG